MRRRLRGAAMRGLAVVAIASVVWPASSSTAAEQSSAERELLDTYAPVVAVRTQTAPCGEGEPYVPIPVDPLFGRDGVVLRGPDGAAVQAPTVDDLATAGDSADWYIDIPGNALRPGCSYEQLHDSLGVGPAVYARVATDPDHPGRMVAQYWFFYLYNDWNDRHEGDWEMIQILFDAPDAASALAVGPTQVAYAQHEGAELSTWGEAPMRLVDDTHPIVYVGAGSHAAYFRSERWFGKSAQSGFGCDDTRGPTTRIEPRIIPIDDADPPAWLDFAGHWGEKQPSFNTGPTGPSTKSRWSSPVTWMQEEGRVGAVSLPADGTAVTDFFCSASRVGSVAFMRFLDQPWLVVTVSFVALVGVLALARRTTWRGGSLDPVIARRSTGQTVVAAFGLVRRHRRVFVPLGLVLVAAGAVGSIVQALLVSSTEVGDVVDVAEPGSVASAVVALTVGLLIVIPATGLTASATNLAVRRLDAGRTVSARAVIVDAARQWRAIVAYGVTVVVIGVLAGSLALLPVALWLGARWAVVVPSSLDDMMPWRRSARLTSGRRVHALGIGLTSALAVSVIPPLVGTLVLLVADWSFTAVNLVAGLVSAVMVPAGVVMTALLYGDLGLRVDDHG